MHSFENTYVIYVIYTLMEYFFMQPVYKRLAGNTDMSSAVNPVSANFAFRLSH